MKSNCFSNDFRLDSKSFKSFKSSKSSIYRSKFFVIYYIKNKNSFSKIGVTIFKKNANSVIRSSIKRLIKESFRVSSIKSLGYSINFVFKKEYMILNNSLLKKYKSEIISDIFHSIHYFNTIGDEVNQ